MLNKKNDQWIEETIKLQGKDWFNHRAEKMNERNKSPIYCNVTTIQTPGIENLIRYTIFEYLVIMKFELRFFSKV